jgi:hypothetical protein
MGVINGSELAGKVETGTFSGTGHSQWLAIAGKFNIALWNDPSPATPFVATIQLELSFDGGVTAIPACIDAVGDKAIYTAPVSGSVEEREAGVMYRWNCTAWTSGNVHYRISGGAATLDVKNQFNL